MKKEKIFHTLCMILLGFAFIVVSLAVFGEISFAAGLVDDTVDAGALYSQYPLKNYQLDFYVDNSWAFLPWNWKSGIGKSIMYGLYSLTNIIWLLNTYLSAATGYVVQEAYELDFIRDMSKTLGSNIQTIAGVSKSGYSTDGFYLRAISLIVLVVGIYAGYTGLVKRETSKAFSALINLVVIFVFSSCLIAYAPNYIDMLNDFSADVSTAALDLGVKITAPDAGESEKDSTTLIRENLFAIQVRQPWLLLQYGTTDIKDIGEDRIAELLSLSPGDQRDAYVKEEIEKRQNDNMGVANVGPRLAMVSFLFLFNILISVFVFLLVGIMLLSQILFIIYAMFLPVSFLLAMLPGQEGKVKKAVEQLFNTIMSRVGITFIVTVAFSLSTMLYGMSGSYPFFLVAFLQIIVFAGIFIKLNDLMGMFSVQMGESQRTGGRMFRRSYYFMRRNLRRMRSDMKRRTRGTADVGITAGIMNGIRNKGQQHERTSPAGESRWRAEAATEDSGASHSRENASIGKRAGIRTGAVLDTGKRAADKVRHTGEKLKNAPTNAKYMVHSAKENVKQNISDFGTGVKEERTGREGYRRDQRERYHQDMDRKCKEMKTAGEARRQREIRKRQNAGPDYQAAPKKQTQDIKRTDIRQTAARKSGIEPERDVRPLKPELHSAVRQTRQDQLYHEQKQESHPFSGTRKEKRKLFQKPDYNEDMTEYLKQREASMRSAAFEGRTNIHAADRTPVIKGKVTVQSRNNNKRKNER